MSRFLELRDKEVINVEDGKRLGFVCDVDFDLKNGTVDAIIIPARIGFWSIFHRKDEYIIPWQNIKKIGDDIIIVDFCLKS